MTDLPSSAKLKLFRLQAAASDVTGQADATTKRIAHLQEALGFAENTEPDVANIEFELSRLRSVLAQQQAKVAARSQVVAAVNNWVNALPANARVSEADAPPPKLMGGETCKTAIERLRMAIPKLSADVRRLRYATMMVEEQRTRASQWVASLAASVTPQVYATHADGFKITVDHVPTLAGSPLLAHLAWLDPDALTERLHKLIDDAPNVLAMPRREQEKRLAEATAALVHAERQEEWFIERAADEGLEIERRPQADPCAVLGLAVVMRAVVIKR